MSQDRPIDSGDGIPEDAEIGDDDTLDLTEAMAVSPPNGEPTDDDTIDLADVTTVVGGLPREEAIGPRDSGKAGEAEPVIDLAAAAGPVSTPVDPEADEEDEEFGTPSRTVAISPEELAGMGLSRDEDSSTPDSPGEDTLREQPTGVNPPRDEAVAGSGDSGEDDILRDAPTDVDALAGTEKTPSNAEDADDRFLDIDTGTLIAMGREFEAGNGTVESTVIPGSGEDEESDEDVLDLGALAARTGGADAVDSDEDGSPDETMAVEPAASIPPEFPEGAATGPEADSAGKPIEMPDDSVDRDASTVFMAPGDEAGDGSDDDVLDLGTLVSRPTGTEADDSNADFLVDSLTVFNAAAGGDETENGVAPDTGAPEEDAADRNAETMVIPPGGWDDLGVSAPSGDEDRDAETVVIPPGGFDALDAVRSGRESGDEDADADRNAETMFMALDDWEDHPDDDRSELSALELLDSISAFPADRETDAEGAETELPEPDAEDELSDSMDELYGLLESSRETGEAADKIPSESSSPGGEADSPDAESDGGRTADGNAVALPGARRADDADGDRCVSVTPEQMQGILERVVDKIFSEKIEKILTGVIERAVADEIRKFESYFMDELDDRGDR